MTVNLFVKKKKWKIISLCFSIFRYSTHWNGKSVNVVFSSVAICERHEVLYGKVLLISGCFERDYKNQSLRITSSEEQPEILTEYDRQSFRKEKKNEKSSLFASPFSDILHIGMANQLMLSLVLLLFVRDMRFYMARFYWYLDALRETTRISPYELLAQRNSQKY